MPSRLAAAQDKQKARAKGIFDLVERLESAVERRTLDLAAGQSSFPKKKIASL